MDPISNLDQLMLLLRQRIMEASRRVRTPRQGAAAPSARESAPSPTGVAALAAVEGVDERQVRRAVVQQILTEQFGAALLNDARFQHVIDRVAETMEEDPVAAKLLSDVVVKIRQPQLR